MDCLQFFDGPSAIFFFVAAATCRLRRAEISAWRARGRKALGSGWNEDTKISWIEFVRGMWEVVGGGG